MGNSTSVLNEKKDIDSYDVIIRMNNAYPRENVKEYIGSRTDIWIVGDPVVDDNYRMKFNPVFTIRIREDGKIDDNLHGKVCLFPLYIHKRLSKHLISLGGKKPTTGSSTLDLFLELSNYESLTICGIDFLRTPDWTGHSLDRVSMITLNASRYTSRRIEDNGWLYHNYIVEENYFMPILKRSRKVILI